MVFGKRVLLAEGLFSSLRRGCIMHEHSSRQASREGTELCKYSSRHSSTKLWKRWIKLVYNSHSVRESKLCPTFRKHRDHMQSQKKKKKFWRQWITITIPPSTEKLLFLQNIMQKIYQIIKKKQPSSIGLSIYLFLTLTCQMITISSWIIVHYLLFYGGCEWNRGISTS